MADHPAIVVIQGAFQTPEFYEAFESKLRNLGYETLHPVLPTCTDVDSPDFPKRTVSDDAKVVYDVVKGLVDQNKKVITLMHSYGGMVGTEAITKDLSFEQRKTNGQLGGVVHQILLGSAAFEEGFSVKVSRGGQWPEETDVHDDGRHYYKFPDRLFNDFTPEDKAKWTPKLIPHSAAIMTYVTTHAAWRFLPSTAIVLGKDEAISAAIQETLANAIGAKVVHLDVGHEPFISATDLTAQKVVDVIASEV